MSEIEAPKVARAVYAGSFDPPTLGHRWVIEAGASVFDELHVAATYNPEKAGQGRFEIEDRVAMLENIAQDYDNVTVGKFFGQYTVRYALNNGYTHLLRGIRNSEDMTKEAAQRHINQDLEPSITTFFVSPPRHLTEVSSSLVVGLVGIEGWEKEVERYVDSFVLDALKGRLEEQRAKVLGTHTS